MNQPEEKAWVFFYGTFMDAEVLRDYKIDCEKTLPAIVKGYELVIRPRVNLVRKDNCFVYGGLAYLKNKDVSMLYEGLRRVFAITYEPVKVAVELTDGNSREALCYISSDMKDSCANPDYVHELAICASRLNAPDRYIKHIRSYA